MEPLAQSLGGMAVQRSGLAVGFGHMADWCLPLSVLRRIISDGIMDHSGKPKHFLFDAVLDDFELRKDMTTP